MPERVPDELPDENPIASIAQAVGQAWQQAKAEVAEQEKAQVAALKEKKRAYDKIKIGMWRMTVRNILGEPDSKTESEIQGLGKLEMWSWSLGFMTGISVHFENGCVSSKDWIG